MLEPTPDAAADTEPFVAATALPPGVPPPPPPPGPPPGAPPSYAAGPMGAPTGARGGPPIGKILAIGGVVLALVVAGLVAWQVLRPRGGAGSPDEAVDRLLTGMIEQDPAAVLDLLSPAEVEGLDDVYAAALERAEEEEVVGEDRLLEALTIELTDLELETEELSDDLARVEITGGRYEVSWDPDKLPERLDFLAEASDKESESGDLEEALEDEDIPASLLTVRTDGRWYVSVWGTFADGAYLSDKESFEDEYGEPDWDAASEDIEPVVGEDPDEVVENLIDALNGGDGEELLANLPSDLARPLRPFTKAIDDGLEESEDDDVELDDFDYETEEEGELLKVVVDRLTLTAEGTTFGVDGNCFVYESEYEDGGEECWEAADDLGLDNPTLMLREADGGYQFDPTATLVESLRVAVENVTADDIEELLEQAEDEVV